MATRKQQIATGVRRQSVIIEYDDSMGPEWLVMFADGHVEVFDTAWHAADAVRAAASKGNGFATVTAIEWRNVPEGFQPPRVAE